MISNNDLSLLLLEQHILWAVTYGLVLLLLQIFASKRVFSLYSGIEVPTWLLLIWLLPVVGALLCFLYQPEQLQLSEEKQRWKRFLAEEPHRKHLDKSERNRAFQEWQAQQSDAS